MMKITPPLCGHREKRGDDPPDFGRVGDSPLEQISRYKLEAKSGTFGNLSEFATFLYGRGLQLAFEMAPLESSWGFRSFCNVED